MSKKDIRPRGLESEISMMMRMEGELPEPDGEAVKDMFEAIGRAVADVAERLKNEPHPMMAMAKAAEGTQHHETETEGEPDPPGGTTRDGVP